MKRGFCPLGSGSKGNALYFSSGTTRLLIDAGLSARQICLRLQKIGVDISEIDAILVTHEHIDHIRALKILGIKYQIPILTNAGTAKGIYRSLGETLPFKIFTTGESFEFRDIEIHPFSIQHDSLDPVAFTLKTGNLKVGVCTDLGFATTLVQAHLQGCDYLVLEANHEPSMVHASPRPMVYKQRVLSRAGHLSNAECGKLLSLVHHPLLKHVHLAHLSQECNSPKTALEVVASELREKKVPLSIAPQEEVGTAIVF
ncbi:MAG: MBL fold metallo-hydrolase [Verrucomicrobia bacterium]|nr:MBL fold metallo-hydrolase [Verrucomicrobiota bacterium]